MRTLLGSVGWRLNNRADTSTEKGARPEALVGFLLSQVEDFRVVERNLRTDTVEAKNWSDKAGQPESRSSE
jgi:hypothetical protein